MKKIILTALLFSYSTYAQHKKPTHDPCAEIKKACEKAGFIQGDFKIGKGLWMDCINPILQNTTAKKSVLPLPKIDVKTIESCKKHNKNFGDGPIGN